MNEAVPDDAFEMECRCNFANYSSFYPNSNHKLACFLRLLKVCEFQHASLPSSAAPSSLRRHAANAALKGNTGGGGGGEGGPVADLGKII